MSKFQIIFLGFFITFLANGSALPAFAQMGPEGDPFKDPAGFGKFEVGLPGIPKDTFIADFVSGEKPILDFINLAVNAVIAVLVIIGLITIVIGGYIYMTASGDASRVKTAKEMIIAALAGIFLSLVSVIILNTINSYLGSGAEEPKLGEPSNGSTPGGGGGSGGSSGGGSGGGGGELPDGGGNTGGGSGIGNGGNNDNTQPSLDQLDRLRTITVGEIVVLQNELENINLTSEQKALYTANLTDAQNRLAEFNRQLAVP
ncbi:MAG: pilin [bacterium]|nr:pilin [bacterium]